MYIQVRCKYVHHKRYSCGLTARVGFNLIECSALVHLTLLAGWVRCCCVAQLLWSVVSGQVLVQCVGWLTDRVLARLPAWAKRVPRLKRSFCISNFPHHDHFSDRQRAGKLSTRHITPKKKPVRASGQHRRSSEVGGRRSKGARVVCICFAY
jgi:hypothetical protein